MRGETRKKTDNKLSREKGQQGRQEAGRRYKTDMTGGKRTIQEQPAREQVTRK